MRSRGGDLPMLRDPSRQFRLLTQLAERDRETVRETETDSDRETSVHTHSHTQGERERVGERGDGWEDLAPAAFNTTSLLPFSSRAWKNGFTRTEGGLFDIIFVHLFLSSSVSSSFKCIFLLTPSSPPPHPSIDWLTGFAFNGGQLAINRQTMLTR